MRKILIGMAIALLFTGTASAQQVTTTLSISADVSASCTVSTNPVVFTGYDGTATVNSTTGDVTTQCSDLVNYSIGLDGGQNVGQGSDGTARSLSDGAGNYLSYLLYSSVSPALEWGDFGLGDTYPKGPIAYTSDGNPYVVGVVADLVADPSVVPGSYSDTVNVIVQF